MKTITLKAQDEFIERLAEFANALNLSKSELIRRAVLNYEQQIEKENVYQQMRSASLRLREQTQHEAAIFEACVNDGLNNEYHR